MRRVSFDRRPFEAGVLSPLGVFTTITSVAFLIAGALWPQAASALLRILLATLALGFIVARAHDAIQSLREEQKTYSPFHGGGEDTRLAAAPRVVQELAFELIAADDPRLASRTPIPWSVRRAIARAAERRLQERHALALADPRDHAAVRALVSEATWSVLKTRAEAAERGVSRASSSAATERTRSSGERATGVAALSNMSQILDDVERL